MNKFFSELSFFYQKSKWQAALTFLSLAGIISYFVFSSNLPLLFILIIGSPPLLWQIVIKIFKRDFGADILAAMGLILAIYLREDLAASLVILMLASGQALEEYAKTRASFALEALAGRLPEIAHLKIGEEIKDIKISEIKIGDILQIFPHESCVVDGEVIAGKSVMDESYLTGEPYQISKTIGSKVISGAVNGEGLLTIRCEKLPQDSRYAQIIKVMEDAMQKQPNMRKIADKIGAIFAPFALIFALATLAISQDLTRFLAVLVVATPCPLLIAVPITLISAISIAAKRGIIIRSPIILEKIPICQTAIFDKTGTLTYGRPSLDEIITFADFDKNHILQLSASLERYSRHPLAIAIMQKAKEENLAFLPAENISEKAGAGLFGKIAGDEILITSRKKFGGEFNLKDFEGLECLIVINQKPAAVLHFRDAARKESKPFVSHLTPHHDFQKIILLSGDRISEVKYLAETLGINEFYASQSPEQKLEIVKKEEENAPVIFMGDGINDAPALMVASAGIAFGKENSVTSLSAGAVILESNLSKVDELIHISEKTRSIALQSAIGGIALSVLGMGFAAFGFINPASAAFLQEVIDVVAILNSLRLTFRRSIESDFS